MKQLIAGIVLVLIIGIAGFFYRNVTEHVVPQQVASSTNSTICTQEAKVCPDGSSVGRTGPSCAFAMCPPPNIEVPDVGITFALPPSYFQTEEGTSSQETLRIYQKSTTATSTPDVIDLKRYPIPQGKTAQSVMIAHAMHATSGLPAKSITEFSIENLGGKSFYVFQTERFEGQIETAYFLPRANDILRFDILERNVTNWTDPKLDIATLPEHAALEKMLISLQVS